MAKTNAQVKIFLDELATDSPESRNLEDVIKKSASSEGAKKEMDDLADSLKTLKGVEAILDNLSPKDQIKFAEGLIKDPSVLDTTIITGEIRHKAEEKINEGFSEVLSETKVEITKETQTEGKPPVK